MVKQYEGMRTSYDTYTDEQLCVRAARGDGDAEAALVTRYYALVRVCARPRSFSRAATGRILFRRACSA